MEARDWERLLGVATGAGEIAGDQEGQRAVAVGLVAVRRGLDRALGERHRLLGLQRLGVELGQPLGPAVIVGVEGVDPLGEGEGVAEIAALWDDAARLGSAEGWANLAWGFARLKQWADADRAAAAAIAVDDRDIHAITAALEATPRLFHLTTAGSRARWRAAARRTARARPRARWRWPGSARGRRRRR